jgi:prepilin-type N-terminal cleavage/methylation domain-containing protein
MRHRQGVTLIELLIVIAIITVLATMIVAVAPKFGERQRASRGAGQLQSWLNLAKQRALRDQRPVGIRLPAIAGVYSSEMMYIEIPNESLGGSITVPFPNYSGSVSPYQTMLLTTPVSMDMSVLPPNPPPQNNALLPRDVITLLNEAMGAYPPRRVVAVSPPPTGSKIEISTIVGGVTYYNYCIILDQALPVTTPFTTQSYQVSRKARPVVGEPVLQLPKDIAIDLDRESTAPGVPPKWYRMYPKLGNTGGSNPFDILFSPSGQVIGAEGNLGSRICLWVRDISINTTGPNVGNDPTRTDPTFLPPGENTLITIYTRTGHVAAHPVDPSGLILDTATSTNWNPFKFTQDGLSSGQ